MPVTPAQLKCEVLQIFVNRVEVANHSGRVRCPSHSPAQVLRGWFHPVLLGEAVAWSTGEELVAKNNLCSCTKEGTKDPDQYLKPLGSGALFQIL